MHKKDSNVVQVGIRRFAKASRPGQHGDNAAKGARQQSVTAPVSLFDLLAKPSKHEAVQEQPQQPATKKPRTALSSLNQVCSPYDPFAAVAKVKTGTAGHERLIGCTRPEQQQQQQQQQQRLDTKETSSQHQQQPDAAAGMHPCPLCGLVLPAQHLQQHVDAELQDFDDLEQQQQQQVHGQAGTKQQPLERQRQEQRGPWQQPVSGLRQQHQQQIQPAHGQQTWQQASKQHNHKEQQQQQQGQHRHRLWQWQQQTAAFGEPEGSRNSKGRGNSRSYGSSRGHGNSSSSRRGVSGLQLAPSKPCDPDGAPSRMLDSFDHWGDSSSNWLDDSHIGLDGAPSSAGECWEGVGRCAVGPRTLN